MRNLLGWLTVAALIGGPLIARLDLAPPLLGFAVFALGGLVALLVAVTSVVAAVRGRALTAGGGAACVVALVFVVVAGRGAGHPRINDFTTDLADPPAFTFATGLPANGGRDMTYPREYAAIQQACCADLHAAVVQAPAGVAYERALAVASSMPAWQITRADAPTGTIEAVATTEVFRFQDDIAIRVRPVAGGSSRVDIRSKSRDGKGDIGANTARIRTYVARVEAGK